MKRAIHPIKADMMRLHRMFPAKFGLALMLAFGLLFGIFLKNGTTLLAFGYGVCGGCSYSFVNWAMLFSRLNRDMLTPGLSADGLQSVRSASTRRRRAPCPA